MLVQAHLRIPMKQIVVLTKLHYRVGGSKGEGDCCSIQPGLAYDGRAFRTTAVAVL